jgi:hypothetical protein
MAAEAAMEGRASDDVEEEQRREREVSNEVRREKSVERVVEAEQEREMKADMEQRRAQQHAAQRRSTKWPKPRIDVSSESSDSDEESDEENPFNAKLNNYLDSSSRYMQVAARLRSRFGGPPSVRSPSCKRVPLRLSPSIAELRLRMGRARSSALSTRKADLAQGRRPLGSAALEMMGASTDTADTRVRGSVSPSKRAASKGSAFRHRPETTSPLRESRSPAKSRQDGPDGGFSFHVPRAPPVRDYRSLLARHFN